MQNKVPSYTYTTEKEQRRLTLSTRLALGASRFSSEVVEYLLRNEHQHEILEIIDVVAHLGRDQRFALLKTAEQGKLGAPEMEIPSEWAQVGEQLWKTEYGIKANFSGLMIPPAPLNTRLPYIFMLMHAKVAHSAEFFFQSDRKVYGGKVWRFSGDKSLDDVEMTHKHTGTFGFWVADEQESPDGCLGKNTNSPINLNTVAVRELGWTTETVPMRQLHGRVHFRRHGVHLDHEVITFCADSGLSGDDVPGMDFDRSDGAVNMDRYDVQGAGDAGLFRRAVVPSNLKPFPLPQ